MTVTARRVLTKEARQIGDVREFGGTRRPPHERGSPEIDPASNRVFVGSSDGGFYALRAEDLSSIWRFETERGAQSEPVYDAELDVVYFGSQDGALYCVRAATGDLVWRYNTGAEVSKRPARVGETLYVANAADVLFAIDRRSGVTRWRVRRPSALGREVQGYSAPTVDGDEVFLGFSDGHVMAYKRDMGADAWPEPADLLASAELGGEEAKLLDVDTTPVVAHLPNLGRVVFVAAHASGVHALSGASGAPVWRQEKALGVSDVVLWEEPAHRLPGAPSDDPILPARSLLLASSSLSGLWALEPSTGEIVWRIRIPDGGISAPVPAMGALLVGSPRHGLHLISPLNGRGIDGIDTGTGFTGHPAVYGKRAYALSNNGVLLALSIDPPLPR